MESIKKKLKIENIFDYMQEKEYEKLKKILPMRISGSKNDSNFIICSCGCIRKNHNSHCLVCKERNNHFVISGTSTKLKKLKKDIFFYEFPLNYKRNETKQSFLFCSGEINLDIEDLENLSIEKLVINKVDVYIKDKQLIFYLNDVQTSFLNIIHSIDYIELTNFMKSLIKQTENINKTVTKDNQIDWLIYYNYSASIESRYEAVKQIFKNILFNEKELKIFNLKFSKNILNVYNYDYNNVISFLKEYSFNDKRLDLLYSDSFYKNYLNTESPIDFVKVLKKLKKKKYDELFLSEYLSYFGEDYIDSYNDLLKVVLYNKDVNKIELKNYILHIQENEAKDQYITINTYASYLQKKKKDDDIYPIDLFLTERTIKKGVK